MYIKKVLEYVYNYAKYIVTDGRHDVKCICMSVPLPDGKVPEIGMEITAIYVFNFESTIVKKVTKEKDMKYKIIKPFSNPLAYKLRGKVIDSSKSIVQVFDFKISLEYDYPDGMNEEFSNNDYVEFFASRLDCIIENYY